MLRRFFLISACLAASGCQTYQYAENVKMIAFTDDLKEGKSLGATEGRDCLYTVLGAKLGPDPSLDRAILHAQNQTEGQIFDNITGNRPKVQEGQALRYMNGVTTSWEGFDAVVVAKRCLVVKGRGYK